MADKKIISIDIKVTEKNAGKAINTTKKAVDGLAASTERLARANNKNRAQSGLNNAILIETGRVASDASYGIQGVANNIGRLTELFQEYARTGGKGGVAGAFRELGKSILGVGGIVVGFQLLLSFLPRIIKKFEELSSAAKILSSISESVGKSAQSLVGNFKIYTNVLLDATSTTEQKQLALKKLKEEYPDFNRQILLDKERTEEANQARLDYIETLEAQAISQAAIAKSQEIYGKIAEIEFNRELDLADAKQKTNEARFISNTAIISGQKNAIAEAALNETLTKQSIDRINSEADAEVAAEQKKLDALSKLIVLADKKRGKSTEESKRRDFVAKQLDFNREIIQSEGRVTESLVQNEEIRIKTRFDNLIKLAQLRQKDFAEEQQRRVDAISNEEDKAKAQDRINIEIANSQKSLNDYIVQLTEERDGKLNLLRLDNLDKSTKALEKEMGIRKEALLSFEMSMATNDLDRFAIQRELENTKTQNILNNLQRVRNEAILNGETTIAIDEKIASTKEQLSNKQTQIDEAEGNAKLAIANNVANAIVDIAGEGSAIGKAVAVSMATINSYEAVTAALGAKPYTPFNIANAVATGAFGLMQVKKILQTKIPGGQTAGAGATQQSISVQSPDFNVVGASPESQLAQTVATQQQKPLRAFVVAKDISNEQELERNIKTTAGV